MKLAYGSRVIASDGNELGILKELVIDPRSRVVTHLVVQSGLLFPDDKLIPAEFVAEAGGAEITLSVPQDAILDQHAADYRQDEYVPLEDSGLLELTGAEARVWARPPAVGLAQVPMPSVVPPGIGPLPPEPEVVVPFDEITLESGSRVRAADGKPIGTIHECVTDDDENITHLLIREGTIFSVPKLIPVDWIARIEDNEVVLAVSAQTVERLPEA
jgi:uncharacterized protein YrrD